MIVRTGGDEYDVPQCAENKEKVTRTCNHTITGSWMPVRKDGTLQNAYAALTPHGTKNGCESKGSGKCQVYLAALHGHCHAPTCLRLDTFNNDTGELLCRVLPVYGGTAGYVADKGGTYDEPGYVANPPCVFEANSTHGLPEPPLMNGMTIRVVHVTNSTYGHHGEMALPQAMLAYDVYG